MQVYIPSWQNVFLSFIRPQRFISFMGPLCFITFSSWQLKNNVSNKPLRSSLRINWFVEVSRIGKKYHFLKNRSVWLDIDTLKLKKIFLIIFIRPTIIVLCYFQLKEEKEEASIAQSTWPEVWGDRLVLKRKLLLLLLRHPEESQRVRRNQLNSWDGG